LSASPWTIYRPAPRLGEHNEEILGGMLSVDAGDFPSLREQRVI
jgi:crotonobetainyl-CoA:carnitine CoA-transferase CaiB-like acyl-CoA transferase